MVLQGGAKMSEPDKSRKFAGLEEQFRQFQNEIATGKSKQVDTALAHSGETAHECDEPVPKPLSEQRLESLAKADEDNIKLKKLEESFRRIKPSKSIKPFPDALPSGNDARVADLDADFQGSTLAPGHKAFCTVIEDRPLVIEERPHFYRAPRDVTMALLAGVKSKHREWSRRWDARGKKRSEIQMAHDFLDVLDEMALECCGAHLETLFPELIGADNFFEIARQLNAISDRPQHRHSGNESFDILLSGAIMASSSMGALPTA